jgi:quinone-modifying oxidoreductase subunit QmoB
MGACPARTINFDNYSVEMVSAMIGAVEPPYKDQGRPRVLVLACENDAYPAIDMAGINRHQFSPYVRIIPVRCLGSVTMAWVADAILAGYDGIMLLGCKAGDDYQCHFIKGSGVAEERTVRMHETAKAMAIEPERLVRAEIAIADSARIPAVIDDFVATIEELGPSPFKEVFP